ncbi:hypothetical protein ABZ671_25195 [Micromonospora sp. NPDC006766]|uniref:hypothetical protein n=1 Tax=Micromonospora sp. NPDC006766 TaxID=3154778 RepID=UPI0033F88E00
MARAAGRAVTGDPIRTGAATIALKQALRALGRDHFALIAAVAVTASAATMGNAERCFIQAAMALWLR